ncbi:hypothetical protein T458_06885 [Brevibacillus panacihumi W25]|uniref:Uncharacterized protein n=1 Tax=Brevibacillus panacihumi W25 TaxID=1408254 RepID=V6MBS8_9BACL|nr:hypothetical protein T458_06885 [Brevibacillus panacihumi W25]
MRQHAGEVLRQQDREEGKCCARAQIRAPIPLRRQPLGNGSAGAGIFSPNGETLRIRPAEIAPTTLTECHRMCEAKPQTSAEIGLRGGNRDSPAVRTSVAPKAGGPSERGCGNRVPFSLVLICYTQERTFGFVDSKVFFSKSCARMTRAVGNISKAPERGVRQRPRKTQNSPKDLCRVILGNAIINRIGENIQKSIVSPFCFSFILSLK